MKCNLLVGSRHKTLLTILFFVISLSLVQAQTTTVTGNVTGEGQALPGVSILVKGTATGTVTDFDGNFEIKTDSKSVLIFTYIGYLAEEVPVNGKSTMNVIMQPDVAALDEVVVVGYGTQKRKEVTGAVGQVKNEALVLSATADLGTALQGQVAGVNVQASDGAPGSESNITIRGISSILGSSSPLYVVDGIPFNGDPKLSMNEIETIDVLKDAASAAIYGTRGAGGVILITTKKGKEGIMKMNFDTYYGIQMITSGVPLLETEDFLYVKHLSGAVLNGTTFGNTWTPIVQGPHQLTNNTNLTDIIENDFAPIQNHSVGISGGKEGLTYSVNATIFDQEGTIINSGYNRFNVRANTQYKKGKWSVNTGMGFGIEQHEFAPWQFLLDAYRYNPYSQMLDPDVETIQHPGPDNVDAQNLSNNLVKFKQRDNRNTENFNANITANYKIDKNLTYTIRGGLSYNNNTRIKINPLFKTYDEDGELIPSNNRSGVRNESGRSQRSTIENILNYKRRFGRHNIQVTAAYSAEKYENAWFFAEKKDLVNNDITVLNGALNDPVVGSGTNFSQNVSRGTLGLLGRIQYNYKGKYLVSASARRDGSSRFSKKYRYNTFPSLSVGWNVSDENFWKFLKPTVSLFKLRASHGTVGNDNFLDYSNAAVIVNNRDYIFGPEEDDRLVQGAIQEAFANENIKWETSVSDNIGFDLGFFSNKLNVSADFYNTKKEDLLLGVILPPSVGVGTGNNSNVILNVGDMVNKGMEWTVNYKQAGTFSWNAGLTFTKNVNEITKMSGSNKIQYLDNSEVVQGVPNEDLVSVLAEGYEAGSFFLIKTDGIIDTQEKLDAYNPLVGGNANLGDLRYVDALTVDTDGDGVPDAGDGIIDLNDRQYAGSGSPEFEMGFNFGANYKDFDISMQWYASFGAEVMNGSKAYSYKAGTHRDLLYQWSPQNTTSAIPTNRGRDHENFRGYTDFWLEDGTFARLRNIAIGYSLPKDMLEKNGISKVRLYVSAQNPITITKYTGFDPEVGNNSLATRGLDRGNYPISSSFRFGVQLAF
ncbi:TonB-dependent receptor [Algibacter amylolyticus]|uniref:TonB-dependent receptor n=1 Tax=Algibacter amylolyticus TaxID=1608400 RepID=A0A5M7B2C3_9FLAO|nr:TonB-dependent receptor [Algibacter amylolyticus]KAA5823723.1 TonB-dependent receptor [Algibacter amylolyticus]MBB5267893.1 TonB-linked SusC/RagA family outer membrane protein [Algibacter amylolyticus]TSJ74211.1 TonB-dependent receptor [Algibacter amylolyticus]